MPINGIIGLYRMPATGSTTVRETDLTDKIELGGDARLPDAHTSFTNFSTRLGRHRTENPVAFENMSVGQDTGVSGDTYSIGLFLDNSGGNSAAIARLRDWIREDNAVKGRYQHGRIGIRNTLAPEFDCLPDNTAGYRVVDFDYRVSADVSYHATATLTLLFSGSYARLGTR